MLPSTPPPPPPPPALPQWSYLSFYRREDSRDPFSPSRPILSFEKTKEEGRGTGGRRGYGGEAIQSSENVAKQD